MEKPIGEFHLYSRQGRQAWCKPCRKEYDRAYHARNAEKRRLQVKEARFRLVRLNQQARALIVALAFIQLRWRGITFPVTRNTTT